MKAFFKNILPLALGILLALALQYTIRPDNFGFYNKIFIDIGINIILAVSLNLVNGFTGQFSIGHAGFMAIGGYASVLITYYGSFYLWGSAHVHGGFLGPGEWLFVGATILGGIVAMGFGYLVGLPSLRLRGDYLAIVTLGFGEIVRVILQRSNDVLFTFEDIQQKTFFQLLTHLGGALGFSSIPKYSNLFWTTLATTLVLVCVTRIKFSSAGRAFLCIREDEIAAEAMGINVAKYKVRAFVLAAFFAGIAGSLFAHEVGAALNPREMGFQKSFEIVIMVVLGGMGSISGSVLAAIVLTILPEVLRSFAEYRMIFYALALIVMMIIRPQGFFGLREIWETSFFKRARCKKT